jgi:hypothetical protein
MIEMGHTMTARPLAFGIDLGTRCVRAAYVSEKKAVLVRDAEGGESIPAVVSIETAGFRVGRAAEARAAVSPAMTVFGAKWWLGRRYDDAAALRGDAVDALPSADGLALISAAAYEPAEIVAELLRSAAALAAAQIGARPASVVLAAPPWLGPGGVAALRAAATAARLTVDRVLAEATAIALALPLSQKPVEQVVVIVDVGAGGISAAVLKVSSKEIVALGASGDDHVGGDAVDRALVRLFREDLGGRAPAGAGVAEVLRGLAETMKRDLSEAPEASAVASILPGAPALALDRERFEPLLRDLCERIDAAIAHALDEAGVTADQAAAAYAAGGMAQVPAVRAQIERSLGRRALLLHPSRGTLALGAATFAGMLTGEIPEIPVLDLTASGPASREVPLPAWEPPSSASRPAAGHEVSEIRTAGAPPPSTSRPPSSAKDLPPASSGPISWSAPASIEQSWIGPASWPAAPPSSSSVPPSSSSVPPSSGGPLWLAAPTSSGSLPTLSSAPPSSARIPTAPIGSGRFARPADAAALLALPIARGAPAAPDRSITLPVLFVRVLAREHVTGVLTLSHPGKSLTVPIQGGRASMLRAELPMVAQAFTWADGTYAFEPGEVPAARESPSSLIKLAVEGLRVLGRGFAVEELEAALGDRLDRAPVLRDGAAAALKRLGLSAAEHRLLEHAFDGVETGRRLIRSGGLGRHTTLLLFVVLTLFELVAWNEPAAKAGESLAAQVEARARKLAAGNHFEALGVHWSAADEAIREAHAARQREIDPAGPWAAAAPEACARMRERVAAAYEVLRDPARRAAHRREAYPLDFESIADLVEQRASSLSMRQDDDAADRQRRMAADLARSASTANMRKISMEALLQSVANSPPKKKPGGEGPPSR